MIDPTITREQLKDYYGRVLQASSDLQTNACCCDPASVPDEIKRIIRELQPEIIERFYGCGSPIPSLLEGCIEDLAALGIQDGSVPSISIRPISVRSTAGLAAVRTKLRTAAAAARRS